jgi:hypothetical protein
MVTHCLTAHMISGHDPPANTRSEPKRPAHGSITGLYPTWADNFTAPHST